MIVLELPKRGSNDNSPREVWICRACENASFMLFSDGFETTIRCSQCNADVTPYVTPHLPITIETG